MGVEPWAAWAENATEATVALVAAQVDTAAETLSALGAVTSCEPMSFIEALELQGSFYDDGTDAQQGLFQVDRLSGDGRDWWAIVEPNGFRLSLASNLLTVTADLGVAFFWNINAVMRVVKVDHEAVIADFDPLIDVDQIPDEGQDLPFESTPRSASMSLLERWTGVKITQSWFEASKPTLIVRAPTE